MKLLEECQLKVWVLNPRSMLLRYLTRLNRYGQRATDVVRKLLSGDIDVGIVGYDMLREIETKITTSLSSTTLLVLVLVILLLPP